MSPTTRRRWWSFPEDPEHGSFSSFLQFIERLCIIIFRRLQAQFLNAEAIRASAGALTTIPVCRVGSIRNTIKTLQAEGFQVVAATEKSRKLLYDADLRRPTALVMGAEETGISKEVLKLCDERLAIPLIGRIESLNVSAAAAVMLFEVVRQRIGAATE